MAAKLIPSTLHSKVNSVSNFRSIRSQKDAQHLTNRIVHFCQNGDRDNNKTVEHLCNGNAIFEKSMGSLPQQEKGNSHISLRVTSAVRLTSGSPSGYGHSWSVAVRWV